MKSKTKVSTVDEVVQNLINYNQHELVKWGGEAKSASLSAIATLNYDGRSVKRNWDLIDLLKKDERVVVGKNVGVHFSDVIITLM